MHDGVPSPVEHLPLIQAHLENPCKITMSVSLKRFPAAHKRSLPEHHQEASKRPRTEENPLIMTADYSIPLKRVKGCHGSNQTATAKRAVVTSSSTCSNLPSFVLAVPRVAEKCPQYDNKLDTSVLFKAHTQRRVSRIPSGETRKHQFPKPTLVPREVKPSSDKPSSKKACPQLSKKDPANDRKACEVKSLWRDFSAKRRALLDEKKRCAPAPGTYCVQGNRPVKDVFGVNGLAKLGKK